MHMRHHVTLILSLLLVGLGTGDRARGQRNDWYWDTVVNLHIDNHSLLIGQGKSSKELSGMYQGIPVDMIQVSAYGNRGNTMTYQSDVLEHLEPSETETHRLQARGAHPLRRARPTGFACLRLAFFVWLLSIG